MRQQPDGRACGTCGQSNWPNAAQCAVCGRPLTCPAPLRSIVGAALTLMGLLVLAAASRVDQGLARAPGLVLNLAGIVCLIGLRLGRRWAWVAIQVQWLAQLAWLFFGGLADHPAGSAGAGAHAIAIAMVWCYIQTRPARAYCGWARPDRDGPPVADEDLLDDPEALEQAEDDLQEEQKEHRDGKEV